jgi:preprotein translocase subunit SecY
MDSTDKAFVICMVVMALTTAIIFGVIFYMGGQVNIAHNNAIQACYQAGGKDCDKIK